MPILYSAAKKMLNTFLTNGNVFASETNHVHTCAFQIANVSTKICKVNPIVNWSIY